MPSQSRLFVPGLIAAGLAVSLPFLVPYHVYPITTFYAEWSAFPLGLACAALVLLRRGIAPPQLPWAALGLIGFCALLLGQVLVGRVAYVEKSLFGVFYALWAALLVWTGAALREQFGAERACETLQGWLAAGAWLMALSGFMQYFEIDTIFGRFVEQSRAAGMYGAIAQRNLFANYLACGLLSVGFIYFRRRIGAPLAVALAAPMAAALAYSGSRSAWVYLLVLLAACALAWRAAPVESGGRPLRYGGLVLAAFVLTRLGPASDLVARSPLEAGVPWLMGADPSGAPLAPRVLLAWHAWRMFEAHPLVGAGFGEFAWNLYQNAAQIAGYASPGIDRNAHNVVLHLLAETGLLGLVAVGAGIAAWAWEVLRRRWSAGEVWLLAVLAVQAAHALVEFPLWFAQFLGMSAILIGIAGRGGITFGVSRLGRWLPAAIVAVGFAAAAVVLNDYRRLQSWIEQAERAQRGGTVQAADQFTGLVELRRTSLFAPYLEMIGAEMMVPDAKLLDAQSAFNARAMHMFPLPSAACRQAVLLAMQGAHDAAWEEWRRLRIVYPEYEMAFRPQLQALARIDPGGVGRLAARAGTPQVAPSGAAAQDGAGLGHNVVCSPPAAKPGGRFAGG